MSGDMENMDEEGREAIGAAGEGGGANDWNDRVGDCFVWE